MGHSLGYRRGTRSKFSRDFREHGMVGLSTYMNNYHIGDMVDIKANGAVHKGMPHRNYHGRTGVIFAVYNNAVGVIVNKRVGGRILAKRICLRVEHIRPSKCQADFKARVAANEQAKAEGKPIIKRQAVGPAAAFKVAKSEIVEMTALPFDKY